MELVQVSSISTGFLVSIWMCCCPCRESYVQHRPLCFSQSRRVPCCSCLSLYSFSLHPPIFRGVFHSHKFFFSSYTPFLFGGLTHRKPGHANNDIQPPLLTTGVFERPHTVPVHIPVRAGSRVHAALADFSGAAGSGFVDYALLDDGAVYGEAVGWCCGGGCCGG